MEVSARDLQHEQLPPATPDFLVFNVRKEHRYLLMNFLATL